MARGRAAHRGYPVRIARLTSFPFEDLPNHLAGALAIPARP